MVFSIGICHIPGKEYYRNPGIECLLVYVTVICDLYCFWDSCIVSMLSMMHAIVWMIDSIAPSCIDTGISSSHIEVGMNGVCKHLDSQAILHKQLEDLSPGYDIWLFCCCLCEQRVVIALWQCTSCVRGVEGFWCFYYIYTINISLYFLTYGWLTKALLPTQHTKCHCRVLTHWWDRI